MRHTVFFESINFAHVFHYGENIPLTSDITNIINSLLPNDSLLLKVSENLVEGAEHATASHPQLVCDICNRVLDVCGAEINNVATKYAFLAEPIVSIALTLHRVPSFRDKGLELFERLVESNIQAAEQALNLLDRNPVKNSTFGVGVTC
ncbi:MAG: hypothetical protein AB1545_12750 [Thermodesulfobacteriota bacterium]